MDLQQFVDSIDTLACVISVEEKENGMHGDIRIVCGNRAFRDILKSKSAGHMLKCTEFTDNSLYSRYFPSDINFEDYCCRAAIMKQPVHATLYSSSFDYRFSLFMLPLISRGNIHYCTCTQESSRIASERNSAGRTEDTASAVLNTCIKLHGNSDYRKTIKSVIKDIRDLCEARSCVILTVDTDTESCMIFAESRASDAKPSAIRSVVHDESGFYEIVKTWPSTLDGRNCLIIKDTDDMKDLQKVNPRWYKSLTSSGVRSIILFPLIDGNKTIGYIWATNFRTENAAKIREILELTTFFVASSLANYLLVQDLKMLSSVDMLTGTLNRNEMNTRVDLIRKGEDVRSGLGIVFADINGLKKVNDANGHIEGDKLIRNAAKILDGIFHGCEIFRAGGDEFMILVDNTNEAELSDLIARIRKSDVGSDQAGFAAGCCLLKKSTDILRGLRTADERMYADKEEFYKRHPELLR